jgi:hypothetical protein
MEGGFTGAGQGDGIARLVQLNTQLLQHHIRSHPVLPLNRLASCPSQLTVDTVVCAGFERHEIDSEGFSQAS